MSEIGQLVSDFGFPVVLAVGMGYFVYYVWSFITNQIEPQLEKMHMQLIRLIDLSLLLYLLRQGNIIIL